MKKITGLLHAELPEIKLNVVDSGVCGLNQIYESPPSLVIIDSTLSDISGIQISRVLKHDPTIRKLPVLLITKGNSDEYVRFSELSLIADVFLDEKNIASEFIGQVRMLLSVYSGLDEFERQQITFLKQDSVRVQAVNRLVQLYDQSITEVTVMKGFRKLFEMIPTKNILHHMLFSLIENVIDYDLAAVFFNDKNREARLLTYHISDNFEIKEEQFKSWTEKIIEELKPQSNEPWAFNASRFETIKADYQEPGKAIAIKHQRIFPFFIETTLTGAIAFFNRKEVNYDIIFPLPLVLQEMSALMRLRRYYSEAEMLSISDALTGLYTHQHFLWCLDREIRQAKRHRTPLTLVNIIVDDFKELNTQWGHQLGDRAIVNIAGILLENVRSIDVLSRAGTRTIMALFPNTDPVASMVALERVQEMLLERPLSWDDQKISLTLTMGVAGLNDKVNTGSEFLAQAQKAVDQARQKGHNCVELLQ